MSRRAAAALAILTGACVGLATGADVPARRAGVPPGMVSIPGGRTRIGSDDGEPSERPTFYADVAPFWLDVHPVTVAEFRRFVEATGYATQAERAGESGVFDTKTGKWGLVRGVSWRYPLDPSKAAADDHPVTQVSWNDAVAYCASRKKRLPSEIEWEHAARHGHRAGDHYAWGDALVDRGRYRANTWQGHFPTENTVADGYLTTSPVGTFGASASGLTDMGGNVWQWCADWYRPYVARDAPFTPGPKSEKVIRGGSFLCDPEVCHGFRVSARGHQAPDTGLVHIGFRCALSLVDKAPAIGGDKGAAKRD